MRARSRAGEKRKLKNAPRINRTAPHQTLACKFESTTLLAGGLMISYIPVAKISPPFTARHMPVKYQIDNDPPDFIRRSYQKMICKMMNARATTQPQKIGL